MQRFIFKNKNTIMKVSGSLIVLGFFSHLVLKNHLLFERAFIIASILGALPIALQAFQALRVKVVSIDLLVTIAVTGAFVIQNFEESAVVTFLFLFGAYLEQRTLNKTRSAIKTLTEMAPETALKKMEDGNFIEIDVDDVLVGDTLLVKTGAKIPVDGIVFSGEGYVNEASITGESLAVQKETEAQVFAGTILESGTLYIIAQRVGQDTTFGKIIELVEEAQEAKSKTERFIDRFAKYYTPFVLLAAIIVFAFTQNLELAVTILVLGCPGALVIGVPVSNVAGIGNGARHGILLKGSEIIHAFSKTNTFIFDKTGTLTTGKPEVSKIVYIEGQAVWSFDTLQHGEAIGDAKSQLKFGVAEDTASLAFAQSALLSIERESDHPLAKAVISFLGDMPIFPVQETELVKGSGLIAKVFSARVVVGNLALMERENIQLHAAVLADVQSLEQAGNSLVLCAVNGELKILVGVRDQIRPEVAEHLSRLKKRKVKNLIMLSGDNQGTVDAVAQELGLTHAFGNMLPEDKSAYVQRCKSEGKIVTFVGDGINDSPSLALADIGIAMGSGTDVAIETSDVVLMNSDFSRLPLALGLARATARNMKQNIIIALGVVVFLLGALIFSKWMNMSIGMLLHEGSILVVILNGMRLLRYKNA